MAHPAIAEAAVFAAHHPKWTERPVAAIVWKPGQKATDDELRAHLAKSFNSMNLPDAYVVVDQVPRNSTGKFMKSKLREQYGDILVDRLPRT
jgi:fatty-acyl-CoA synthase